MHYVYKKSSQRYKYKDVCIVARAQLLGISNS